MNPFQAPPQGNSQIPQNAALFAQMAQAPQQGMPQGMSPGAQPPMPPQMQGGQQGMPQQGGMPQLPPELLQMLMQGQQPSTMGPPPQPQGMAPQMNGQPQPRFSPQELGALGRFGDTIVAHMTPGEMAVPPQVQTPKVLATLKEAFKQHGANPQQFVAGSPQSSVNPQTGQPEYSFFSSILPMALSLGGSFLMPELMPTMLGSGLLSQSVGGGLGNMLGGLLSGQGAGQSALGGLLSGAGSYGLGSLMGGSGSGTPAAQQTANASSPQTATGAMVPNTGNQIAGQSGPPMPALPPSWKNLWGNTSENINTGGLMGAGLGGMLGGSLFGPQSSNTDPNANLGPPQKSVAQLPSAREQLGQNVTKEPNANFKGYNPYVNNPMAYNFFPPV